MKRPSRPTAALLIASLALLGCRSRVPSESGATASIPPAAGGLLHFADGHYELDYPPAYKVIATPVGADEWLGISPKVSSGMTDGEGTLQADPIHPDMLLDDELKSYAKEIAAQDKRILGGIRNLAVKNGTCKGFVELDPWKPCPANAPFKPASGDCYDANFFALCKTPSAKRLVYAAQLGPVPTADRLTPEAADYGRVHERILSTLEFK